VVFAADDVGHSHVVVVYYHRQVEQRFINGARDNKVAELGGVKGHFAAHIVVEGNLFVGVFKSHYFFSGGVF